MSKVFPAQVYCYLRLTYIFIFKPCPAELLDLTYPANSIVCGTWGEN